MREGSGPYVRGSYGDSGDPGGNTPRGRRGGVVLSHLAAVVIAAGAAVGVTLGLSHPASSSATTPALPGASAVPSPAASSLGGTGTSGSVQQVVNKVEPGLVVVDTTLQYSSEAGAGTGMVINPAGLVLTNNHVIAGSTKITATVVATGRTYPATVVGYDKTGDIALIRLQGAAGLKTVPVGNSAEVRTGEPVVALGNAEGQGTIIPAGGQVTGLDKTITAADQGGTASTETLHGMIQTNADVVPGDSGGPLATTAGQVIGMDTAGNNVSLAQQQPTGFAIPINTALAVARQIAAGTPVPRSRSGTRRSSGFSPAQEIVPTRRSRRSSKRCRTASATDSEGSEGSTATGPAAPRDHRPATPATPTWPCPPSIAPVSSGTLVDGTICGSPAASAGITGGSVITAVNGQPGRVSRPPHHHPGPVRSRRCRLAHLGQPRRRRVTSTVHLAAGPPQ